LLRWLIAAIVVCLVAFAGLSAYWRAGANTLPGLLRDAGFVFETVEVEGYPFQWRIALRPLRFEAVSGWRARIDDAVLEFPLLGFDRPVANASGDYEVVAPDARRLEGSVGHVGAKLELKNGWPRRFAIALADLRCRDCRPAIGPKIDRIEALGAIAAPPPARANVDGLRSWRERGGQIEIGHGALRWGPLEIWGSLSLGLNDAFDFEGRMTGEFMGIAEAAEAMVQAGEITLGEATSAALGIALSTKIGDPDDGVVRRGTVDVLWRDGKLWLGRFPVLALPWAR